MAKCPNICDRRKIEQELGISHLLEYHMYREVQQRTFW